MHLFKIRSSKIGEIMAGTIGLTDNQKAEHTKLSSEDNLTDKQSVRLKELDYKMNNPKLPETLKSYVKMWIKEQIYNTKYSFSSKYTEKGLITEDDSIDFVAEYLKYGMLIKNEQYYENDFLTGTPDIITNDEVIDLKNSWDCFTFPLFSNNVPNQDYYYQLQGYMSLTCLKKAKLIYVLSDTPSNLIEREAYFYCKNNGFDELDMDIYKEFEQRMTFKNIPDKLKIKVFEIERDDQVINDINNRVVLSREYIKSLNY
jgi:hypothetical protein